MEIKLVRKKGNLDRFRYVNLSEEEKNIKENDLIEEANNPNKEFIYKGIGIINGKEFIKVWSDVGERCFYPDSIKKASSQIKKEKQALRKLKKLNAKKIKK